MFPTSNLKNNIAPAPNSANAPVVVGERPWRRVGNRLNCPTGGAGAQASTEIQPTADNGPVIGLTVNKAYADADLSQLLLTIEQSNTKPMVNVPLSEFVPGEAGEYVPLDTPLAVNSNATFTLTSYTANALAATKPVIIFHHRKPSK